ncbi:hypothetical protein NGRA_0930 [Nosema granulosis]|uniref:Uncharacterized protein n=1 Tax=Nosema granulosis TaxID=83296 RepID=A0A9P6H261_9MICR|nr:hypothetical protein NGRA_0930 [Nosema granulosis]
MRNSFPKSTTNLFINELRKSIPAEDLIALFEKYLNQVGDHAVMRHLFDVYEERINRGGFLFSNCNKEILISCHSVFKYVQSMTDIISSKSIDPYDERSMEVMASLTLYGAVYEIFKNEFENSAELVKLYENVCMSMNSPRNDSEEDSKLIKIRSTYYLDLFLPLKLFGINHNFTEDLFILFSLLNVNEEKLSEYYYEKLNTKPSMKDIMSYIECDDEKTMNRILEIVFEK